MYRNNTEENDRSSEEFNFKKNLVYKKQKGTKYFSDERLKVFDIDGRLVHYKKLKIDKRLRFGSHLPRINTMPMIQKNTHITEQNENIQLNEV